MPSTSTTKKKTSTKTTTSKSKPKTAAKKKASSSKSTDGRTTTKLTKKDEDIIKKRLKKLLQKEGSTRSVSKPSTSKSTSGCSSGSCFSSNTTKKFVLSESKPSSSSGQGYFTTKNDNVTKKKVNNDKKTKNKTAVAKKKSDNTSKPKSTTKKTVKKSTSTSTSGTKYSCSNGQCTIRSKPKSSSSSTRKLKCTSGGCFFLKASTETANKTNSTKNALKRKAPEIKPTIVQSKKSNSGNLKSLQTKNSKTNVKAKAVTAKSKSIPPKKRCSTLSKPNNKKAPAKTPIKRSCGPCITSSTSDSESDDYSDEDDYSDDSSFSDESDFDDSDEDSDDGRDQRGCGPSRRGYSRKNYDSYESDSWETDTGDSFECTGGSCPFVKKRKISQGDDNDETEENLERALVPVKSNIEKGMQDSYGRKYIEEKNYMDGESLGTVNMIYRQEGQSSESKSASDSSDKDYIKGDENYSEESYSSDSDFTQEGNSFSDEYSSGKELFEEESEEESTSLDSSEYSHSDYTFNESSNDTDYQLPENEVEDVYIPRGDARTYPLMDGDENINFDSDASSLQAIEITSNTAAIPSAVTAQEETSDSVQSEDSCPQLVPIQGNMEELNTGHNEFFHISESDSEMDNQSPKMVAHIFKNIKTDTNNRILNFSSYSIDEKNQSSVDDANSSPLDKISNKSASLNISHYKIITAKLHNSLDEEVMQHDSLPTTNIAKEPYKMKAHIFEVDKVSNNYLPQIEVNKKNLDKNNIDTSSEVTKDLTPLEKITNLSACSDNAQYEVITTRKSFKESEICTKTENQKSTESLEYRSKFYNSINSRHVLVLLKETFYIYGTLKLKLIAGGVDVFGYNVKINEVCEVFSPRGNSSLYMKPVKGEQINKTKITNELSLLEDDFIKNDLSEIVELFDESCDAIILLERNDRNKIVNMLKKYVKENLFPNMNCFALERPFYASEFILRCTLSTTSKNALKINPHWTSINLTTTSKIMVIGGKSVGKSTLVRYLINRNIQRFKKILLIDLDIGQPEIFVPQTVSVTLIENPLLGPGYFYGLTPEKSCLFGDINVVLSPISYLRNVKELIRWCHQEEKYKDIPWIINTMGYSKGFGSELISAIAQILDPSNIIQIRSSREINNFDYFMIPETIKSIPRNIFFEELDIKEYEPKHQFVLFESANVKGSRSTEWEMAPKDMRFTIVISRLGTILTGRSEWLSDVKPVSASVEDLDIICFSEDHIKNDDLLDVINANLVYLCRKTENCIECYGIGIVRGVDRFQQKIYLLPSVALSTLRNIDCLAICNIPLPTSILLNQGPKVKDVAPYTYNTNDFVASKHINQIRYTAQYFLQGKHKNVL